MRIIAIVALGLCVSGCAGKPPGYETSTMHADGSPVTQEDRAEMQRRRDETQQLRLTECRRLYQMFGDRSLAPMQIEAVRVSYNTKHCAEVAPQ
jgi:hypothetical protein